MSETYRYNKRGNLKALVIGCLLLVSSGALNGCGPHPVTAPNPKHLGKIVEIHHFNSPIVNVQIRSFLYHSVDALIVKTHDMFNLNELPDTILEWIRRCVSAKGEIIIENYLKYKSRGTRGAPKIPTDLESGIAYFWDRYQEWKKDRWYKPIARYNIKIVYKGKEGRGRVNRIIFERKDPLYKPQAREQKSPGGVRYKVWPDSSDRSQRERTSAQPRREQRRSAEPRRRLQRDEESHADPQPQQDQPQEFKPRPEDRRDRHVQERNEW